MRINRWLSSQGHCSRREADAWIQAGRVTVNGARAELGCEIGPEDKVSVDNQPVRARRVAPVVIAYNKPVGIECTSNQTVPNNIIDAVKFPERIVHVGRLDVMSEGLILLTNQGDIVQALLLAENGHEREYAVTMSKSVSQDDIMKLARGVDIGDDRGPTLPCRVERLSVDSVRMVLVEGRNRQIRRMAEAIGNHVRRLERVRIMNLRLGNLPRGGWRHLTPSELRELYQQLKLERPKGALRSETPKAAPGAPKRAFGARPGSKLGQRPAGRPGAPAGRPSGPPGRTGAPAGRPSGPPGRPGAPDGRPSGPAGRPPGRGTGGSGRGRG